MSPSKRNTTSPRKSPHKKVKDATTEGAHGTQQEKANNEGLTSPTSVSMRDSFIIKNADESFDAYYAQMRKRKHHGNFNMHNNDTHAHAQESKFGLVHNHKPTARDGHSSNISNGYMYVFGGDRHHMPFNDLYMIKLS